MISWKYHEEVCVKVSSKYVLTSVNALENIYEEQESIKNMSERKGAQAGF